VQKYESALPTEPLVVHYLLLVGTTRWENYADMSVDLLGYSISKEKNFLEPRSMHLPVIVVIRLFEC
jgi:hypothetical protein